MTDTSHMIIAHFVRELDSLRSALGYDRVHLLGHSWGTILGFEYYRAHPQYVASLTLASAALDIPTWERNTRRLVGTLSDSAQRAIEVREAEQTFVAPDYTLKTYDVTSLLETIMVPTLYTVGEFDEADRCQADLKSRPGSRPPTPCRPSGRFPGTEPPDS